MFVEQLLILTVVSESSNVDRPKSSLFQASVQMSSVLKAVLKVLLQIRVEIRPKSCLHQTSYITYSSSCSSILQ